MLSSEQGVHMGFRKARNQPAEWTFARLTYPSAPNDGYAGRFDGDWHEGLSLEPGPPARPSVGRFGPYQRLPLGTSGANLNIRGTETAEG